MKIVVGIEQVKDLGMIWIMKVEIDHPDQMHLDMNHPRKGDLPQRILPLPTAEISLTSEENTVQVQDIETETETGNLLPLSQEIPPFLPLLLLLPPGGRNLDSIKRTVNQ